MHPVVRTLRDAYRSLTGAGKPRRLPVRAVGTIEALSTDDEPSPWWYGAQPDATVRKHHIKLSFEVDGIRIDAWREVASLSGLREGDKIVVNYVLGDIPPRSWVDRRPKRLSDQQISSLERGVLSIRERGRRAVGKVSRVESQRLSLAPGHSGSQLRVSDVYCVTYDFNDDEGRRWTGARLVADKGDVEVGSNVHVRYLPDNPVRNTIVT